MVNFRIVFLVAAATAVFAAPLQPPANPGETQDMAPRATDDLSSLERRLLWTHIIKGLVKGTEGAVDTTNQNQNKNNKRDLHDAEELAVRDLYEELLSRALDEEPSLYARSKASERAKGFFKGLIGDIL